MTNSDIMTCVGHVLVLLANLAHKMSFVAANVYISNTNSYVCALILDTSTTSTTGQFAKEQGNCQDRS